MRSASTTDTHPIAAAVGFLGMLFFGSWLGSSGGAQQLNPLVSFATALIFTSPFIGIYLFGEDVIQRPWFVVVPIVGLILPPLVGGGMKGEGILLSALPMFVAMVAVRLYYSDS